MEGTLQEAGDLHHNSFGGSVAAKTSKNGVQLAMILPLIITLDLSNSREHITVLIVASIQVEIEGSVLPRHNPTDLAATIH